MRAILLQETLRFYQKKLKILLDKKNDVIKSIDHYKNLNSVISNQLDNVTECEARCKFLGRIENMIQHIEKQKAEACKVRSDTILLRKEINAESGKLIRREAVIEEKIFRVSHWCFFRCFILK